MQLSRRRSDVLFSANRGFLREVNRLGPDLEAGEQLEGQIRSREAMLLYVLAKRAAQLGNVVEIGAYKGKSTWYLARGLEAGSSPYRVVSIDPHLDPEQREAYFASLARFGLDRWIEPRVAFSHDVAAAFDEPVGLLWIDGDHRYPAAREDFDDWFPQLSVGGWIAIHDTTNAWHGPTQLGRELLGHRADLAEIGVVLTTLFCRKVRPRATARLSGVAGRVGFELLTLAQARHKGLGADVRATADRPWQ